MIKIKYWLVLRTADSYCSSSFFQEAHAVPVLLQLYQPGTQSMLHTEMDLFPKTGKGQVLKQPRKSIDVASLATLEEEDFIEYPELEGTHTDDQVHISKCRSGRKEEE